MESISRKQVVEVLARHYASATRHIADMEKLREHLRSQKKKDGARLASSRWSLDVAHNKRDAIRAIARDLDIEPEEYRSE